MRNKTGLVIDLVLAALPVLGLALAYQFESNTLLLINMTVYIVLAQGINVIYGFTGYLPFGYGGFFGVGAYGMAVSVSHFNLPALAAVITGGATAVIVSLVLIPLLRLRGAYFAIASLASALALAAVISNPALQEVTGGPYGVHLDNIYNLPGSYVLGVVLVGLSTLLVVYLRRSRLGLIMLAVRADQISASMGGINVGRVRAIAWIFSAALAGLAGGLYAWSITTFYPDAVFALNISLFAIVFALFGGAGSVLGPVVGSVVLYGVYNMIGISQPQYFQLIFGILIIMVVLFLPRGMGSLVIWATGKQRGLPNGHMRRRATKDDG